MAPNDYIQARKSGVVSCIIDNRPYLPQLKVDVSNDASILAAAEALVTIGDEPTIQRIQGGLTNDLFRISSAFTSFSCLVRVFGAEGLIDRDMENTNFAALSQQGLAPAYYGRFANGRVEGWLNMRPLAVRELPLYAKQIASSLGTMHSTFSIPPTVSPTPALWTQLRDWMHQALVVTFSNEVDAHRVAAMELSELPAQLDWLQQEVVPRDAPVAFCHNDLLAANILVAEGGDTSVQLIDFEYGSVNFIGFDIANHFNEYAGGTDNGVPQYTLLPTEAQQEEFIGEYLKLSQISGDLYTEVRAFMLVNHLYWGLWAVNQGAKEGCDEFDYLLYAQNRIGQYRKSKRAVVVQKRNAPSLSQ